MSHMKSIDKTDLSDFNFSRVVVHKINDVLFELAGQFLSSKHNIDIS